MRNQLEMTLERLSVSSDDGLVLGDGSCRRGILKYPRGWQRRAYSESHADDCELIHGEAHMADWLDNLSISSESPDDLARDDKECKPKKSVRFNSSVSKTTFFQNSAIISKTWARRNRRRNLRANSGHDANNNNHRSRNGDHPNSYQIGSRLSLKLDTTFEKLEGSPEPEMHDKKGKKGRTRQDSGYDSETSNNNNNNTNHNSNITNGNITNTSNANGALNSTTINLIAKQSCAASNNKCNRKKFTVKRVDLVA